MDDTGRSRDFWQLVRARRFMHGISSRFSHGMWLTLGSLGDIGPTKFNPPRYPRDAQAFDLNNIGRDMYVAFGRFSEENETTKPKYFAGNQVIHPATKGNSR